MRAHHSIKDFTFDKAKRLLVAEASTLTRGDEEHLFGQAYPDACDEGFVVIGERHEVGFVVVGVDWNGDEIAGWHLQPIKQDERLAPGVRVLVIND